MSADTLDWIGHSLGAGRYRVTALLGEGGMGIVYKAHDANLDNEVVVKIPKLGLISDHEFTARFAREIRSLVRLAHAHIVRVLDVGEYQELPFAVMQYLNGGSLRDRLSRSRSGSAALADLPSWLPSVADALDYIHLQGYVHRDVKPDNILFDAASQVYLGDFGIVKALAASEGRAGPETAFKTSAGLVVGTPQYMAPELITAQGCDGRVDQYALAVTVYEAVCTQVPFEGRTPAALAVLQATKPPRPPHEIASGIPLAFSTAMLRGLAKEPKQRFADCRSLAQALLATVPGSGPVRPDAVPIAASDADKERFTCPHCSQGFRLPAEKRGKSARCPRCRNKFILGAGAVATETASGGLAPTPLASPAADIPPVLQAVTSHRAKPSPRSAEHPAVVESNRLDQPRTVLPGDRPRRKLRWLLGCGTAVVLVMVLLGSGIGMWLRRSRSDERGGRQDLSVADTAGPEDKVVEDRVKRKSQPQDVPVTDSRPTRDSDSWIQRARSQHQLADYGKALDDWEHALKAAQGNKVLTAEILVGRADTYLSKQDYESALRDCTQALRLNPQTPHAVAVRGIAYLRLKQFDEALADLSRAIDLDPSDARALRERDKVGFERADYLMTYLPNDCRVIVSVRMDQLFQSEVFQELRREIPEFDKSFQEIFGKPMALSPNDVDQMVVGVAPEASTVVLAAHTKKPITARDLRALFSDITFTETSVGKYVLHESPQSRDSFCIVNQKCVLVGTKAALRGILQRDAKPELSKHLGKALVQLDFSQTIALALAVDSSFLIAGTNTGILSDLQKKLNSLAIQATLSSHVRFNMVLLCQDAATANDVKKEIDKSLSEMKKQIDDALASQSNEQAMLKEIANLLQLSLRVEGNNVKGGNTVKIGPLIQMYKQQKGKS